MRELNSIGECSNQARLLTFSLLHCMPWLKTQLDADLTLEKAVNMARQS